MKKLMFVAAVAAGMVAFGDAIESQNVVGYQAHSLPTESSSVFNMGVSFLNPATVDGSYVVSTNLFGNELAKGDVVYKVDVDYWDFNGYTYNGYKSGVFNGWGVLYADGDSGKVNSFSVAPGEGIYFEPGDTDQTPVISGEVAASGTQTVEFDTDDAATFQLVNPFPVATTFADLETFVAKGDVVYVVDVDYWDFTGYTYNGYKSGVYNGWTALYADGDSGKIMDNTQVILPAGKSGFLEPGGSCEWNVTLNY